jgi:hypothetical protein
LKVLALGPAEIGHPGLAPDIILLLALLVSSEFHEWTRLDFYQGGGRGGTGGKIVMI